MKFRKSDKRTLVKILARENVSLVYDSKAPTASFDLINRIVHLPVFPDMPEFVYDWFIAHEISHALNTPTDRYGDAGKVVPPDYINVTEDIRIEKLVLRDYPGLARDYRKFYEEFAPQNRDFFKIKNKDLTKLSLINRINLHYKLGVSGQLQVPFSQDEQKFLAMGDACETFDDALAMAKALFEYAKENESQQQDQQQSQQSGQGGNQSEKQQGQSGGDNSADGSDSDDSQDGQDQQSGSGKQQQGQGQQSQDLNKFKAETQNDFDKSLACQTAQGQKKEVQTLPDQSAMPLSEIVDTIFDRLDVTKSYQDRYDDIMRQHKGAVNYMTSRFLMKRSARDYTRTKETNSGKLDLDKISEYKLRSDMFLANEVSPDQLNHGFVFFIDWSSSMSGVIEPTVIQLMAFLEFCQKVGVPFEAYLYTNGTFKREYKRGNPVIKGVSTDLKVEYDTRITKIADSAWPKKKTKSVMGRLVSGISDVPMSTTPLNTVAIHSDRILANFREVHKVDKLNLVVLTDGEATDTAQVVPSVGAKPVIVLDPKTYQATPYSTYADIIGLVKKRQGLHKAIGLYITRHADHAIRAAKPKKGVSRQELATQFESKGYCEVPNPSGYDSFYGVNISASNSLGNQYLAQRKWDKATTVTGDMMKQLADTRSKSLMFLKMFIDDIA